MKKITFAALLALTFLASPPAFAGDKIYTGLFSIMAVSGYDTVAYFTKGKPVKGKEAYKTRWKNAEWLFTSEANLEKFKQTPEKYAPQYGGHCAWAVSRNYLVKGDPHHWHIEDGKLYLNYNKSAHDNWLLNLNDSIVKANKNFPALAK